MKADSVQGKVLEIMRRQNPDEYTDGEHGWVDGKRHRLKDATGNLNEATWQDYRASLAERFIAANNLEWKMPPSKPARVPKEWDKSLSTLTEKAWNHILYGDRVKERNSNGEKTWKYQGGHESGYGWINTTCEFSNDMSELDILEALKNTLITGNRTGRNAILATSTINGVAYQAVLSSKGIISFYPLRTDT